MAPWLLLSGLEPGQWALRLLGIVWLAVGVAFVLAGIGVLTESSWMSTVVVTALVLSTVLSLLWVKDAPLGLVANMTILVVLLVPALHDRVLPS